MCSHVNCLDPTHLVPWLLVNFPHLCQLVTLLICSFYNLLVFAVLWEFVICCVCLQPSPALPVCFPLWGSFCLFILLLIKPYFLLQVSPRSHPFHQPCCSWKKSDYYECWKLLCCIIFLWKIWCHSVLGKIEKNKINIFLKQCCIKSKIIEYNDGLW